jgi:uncharacterized protein with beta-barrel porin domain
VAHDKCRPTTQPCAATHGIALPSNATPAHFNHSTWRRVLATGVASAALFAYSGRPVRAAPPINCTSDLSGTIVTCTGDQSAGVDLPNGGGTYTTLNVNNLTTDIQPAAGVTGIIFTSNGAVQLNVDPGPFAILATDANGIFASSNGAPVSIRSTADIVTTGGSATGLQGSGQNALLTITSSGNIATSGNNAFGIAAGTVYGDIIVNSSGNIATSGTFAAGINVGTIGEPGTTEGAITINSSGNIATSGSSAIGINAASVYGPIEITSFGDVAVSGTASIGINAQTQGDVRISSTGMVTTGPSGGTAISALSQDGSVTIWSSGDLDTFGVSADGISALGGDSVDITSMSNIKVSGANSSGINAQSDGDIRITSSGNIATHGDTDPALNTPIGAITAMSLTGNVTVLSSGDIATDGEDSVGIYAAAGGAAMVFSYGSIVTRGDGAAAIAAEGYTGTAVVSTSNIRTYGDSAPGITVMSDGDAAVMSSGNITTTGDTSDGISVMSNSGRVAIVNSGDISATGAGSAGIYAASYAGTSVINFGAITGCPCGGVILRTYDGDNNLVNFGAIIADINGSAIEMDTVLSGGNLVENFGTVTGNVLMAGVAGSVFQNNAGALFNPGDTIVGNVSNAGTLAPGGRGAVETTDMTGSLTQSGSGTFAIDIAGGAADRMDVSDFADLAGKVAVTLTSLPTTAVQSYLVLEALSGVTDNGLSLTASPALHATLTYPNATDVVLGIAVDFTVDALNPNQRAIAENLDQIFVGGVGTLGPAFLGLLNVGSIDEFKNALDQLSPEIYSDAEIAALYSSLAFSNSLLSCKVNGTDTASIIREGQCLWAGASARFLDSNTTSDQIGFNEAAGLFTAGAQVALDDVWRLGAAAGYQSSTLQTATGAQSEGSLAQAGVSLKYNPGPLLLAGALTGGGARYDTTRPMAFAGFTGLAEGDQDLGIFAAAFRAAYVLGTPHLYFKPILDANLTHLELSGFTESGGNGAALAIDGAGHTVFSLAPMLETGTEWWLGNGTLVRPLIRAGAIWYEGADFATTASFAGAPLGVSPFTINTDIDEVMGLVGAGVEVINGGDAVLRLSYEGQLGADTQIHSVGIKGSSKF